MIAVCPIQMLYSSVNSSLRKSGYASPENHAGKIRNNSAMLLKFGSRLHYRSAEEVTCQNQNRKWTVIGRHYEILLSVLILAAVPNSVLGKGWSDDQNTLQVRSKTADGEKIDNG